MPSNRHREIARKIGGGVTPQQVEDLENSAKSGFSRAMDKKVPFTEVELRTICTNMGIGAGGAAGFIAWYEGVFGWLF